MNNILSDNLGNLVKAGGGKLHTGPFGSQLHAADYVQEGIPCIMPANMKSNRVDLSDIAYITEGDANRLSKYIVKKDDIVYSRRGDVTLKALIREKEDGYFCGTGCLLLRPGDKFDSRFLTHYLSTPTIQNWIVRQAVGATMPNLNTGILASIPFNGPKKEEQERIADVLSVIEDKIELNNSTNSELEAMAKTLYDYWFVQFDFPDVNGKPYKASGGKMVYNDTLKREIPEGWELVPLEYFADVIDPHPSHRAPKEVEHGFPFAGIGDIDESGNIAISKARKIDEEFVDKQERDYAIGDYSLGFGRVGTVGKVVRLKKQKFRYALSPTLSVINPKKPEHAGYLYTVIKSEEFYKNVLKNTSGTTRPAIGIQLLRKKPVIKPRNKHVDMFERYEKITRELFEKTSIANQENQELIELRDWLLPMLMNGQVTVNQV
jgi:type I restriction enzyme S subunit